MSRPRIDWSKGRSCGFENDATWLKTENSTLRARVKELEAEVVRLTKVSGGWKNGYVHCRTCIAELEAEVADLQSGRAPFNVRELIARLELDLNVALKGLREYQNNQQVDQPLRGE